MPPRWPIEPERVAKARDDAVRITHHVTHLRESLHLLRQDRFRSLLSPERRALAERQLRGLIANVAEVPARARQLAADCLAALGADGDSP